MDIADFHVATIRAGQFNEHRDNDTLSSVTYDQKTSYYDLTGTDFTADDFAAFVDRAWGIDRPDEDGPIEVTTWAENVYRVSLD